MSCRWTTDICLYMLYPYLLEPLYDAVVALHTYYCVVCCYYIDTAEVEKLRPELMRGLAMFER